MCKATLSLLRGTEFGFQTCLLNPGKKKKLNIYSEATGQWGTRSCVAFPGSDLKVFLVWGAYSLTLPQVRVAWWCPEFLLIHWYPCSWRWDVCFQRYSLCVPGLCSWTEAGSHECKTWVHLAEVLRAHTLNLLNTLADIRASILTGQELKEILSVQFIVDLSLEVIIWGTYMNIELSPRTKFYFILFLNRVRTVRQIMKDFSS